VKIVDTIPFSVDSSELFRRLRLEPEGECAAEVLQMAEQAAGVARPKVLYDVAFVEGRSGDEIDIAGVRFRSRVLSANLDKVERVFPYIATCGIELDRLAVDPGDFVGEFCRDTLKAMALEAAMDWIAKHVKTSYALKRMAGMHPGSGDAEVWPIEQQRELFSLFGDVESMIGVRLTDSFLMLPNKSVSGVFYPTEEDFVTCQLCHRTNCPNRQAPFDAHLWEQRCAGAGVGLEGGHP
jgi:hypothetical protein